MFKIKNIHKCEGAWAALTRDNWFTKKGEFLGKNVGFNVESKSSR